VALGIFERLGARPAAEMARQRLGAVSLRERDKERYGGLTAREREVAALIAQGKSNRQIAATMTVGVKTVETYITRMLGKLDFQSRVQIATWTLEQGRVDIGYGSEYQLASDGAYKL
jgi:DNA-binding NarL/FixJ family response regulator